MVENIDKENLSRLSDTELFKACKQFGLNPGPITATTRSVYEKRLRRILDALPAGGQTSVAAAATTTTQTTAALNETKLEHEKQQAELAKLKLEQTMLAKQAAERELQVQRELEMQRELERRRELEREREKAIERERERERER